MNVWDVVVPGSVLALVFALMIVLVMSFYQTGQDAKTKRRVLETDANTRYEREHMQRLESEIRLMNAKGNNRG